MINRFIKRTLYLFTPLLPALFAACLAGCVVDHSTGRETVAGTDAAFGITVPGMATPHTRALDAGKEKELSEVDVVIFSNTDNTLLEHHRATAAAISPGTGGNDYLLKIGGIENTENITAAVIANASAEVNGALEAVKSGGTYAGAAKADFLLALRVNSSAKWSTSATGYWTIPMYGEASVAGSIYNGTMPTVSLTRMLAKVDVVNNVAPADPLSPADGEFRLTAVHVVNYNTAGVIAPVWNAVTGELETPPATAANLPAGFDPGKKAWEDGNELSYILGTEQTSLTDEIYLFESDALSGNTPPTAPDGLRLVLEGYYTSGGVTKSYYYPADFTYPRQGGATEYMPVLRNNRYTFTITEACGRGYDRLGEAAAAFGVMSNLKTSLLVLDESGIKHMVWNGEHFLGVSEKEFSIPPAGQQDIELRLSTNYLSGWKAEVEDAVNNAWLTFGGGNTTASGQVSDKTLTFNVAATADPWAFNPGSILLTAGRLELCVDVTQGQAKIVAEPGSVYMLDGVTENSFKVKSNTQWAVKEVDDPDGVLLDSAAQIADMLANQGGGHNYNPGDDFRFTLAEDIDGTLSGKTFTVTFTDPTGKAADVSVTVNTISAYIIDQGSTQLFMWPYDQPTGYTWYNYANVPDGTNVMDVPPAGPQNATPHEVSCAALPGPADKPWRLPTRAEMNDICIYIQAHGTYAYYGLLPATMGSGPGYWSATSNSVTHAMWNKMDAGNNFGSNSDSKGRVSPNFPIWGARCVRDRY